MLEFTLELAQLEPEEFAERALRRSAASSSPARTFASDAAAGDLELLARLGFEMRMVPVLEGVSSTAIRGSCARARSTAAHLLGRPPRSTASSSAATRAAARSASRPRTSRSTRLLVPRYGIYAGARRYRARASIGTNPHYGGPERRIEAFLLDYEGDLYGRRLVVELWARLRDEPAFASEPELIEQIASDVDATRKATRPA